MKYSIRTRLTLLTTFIYLIVFFFLVAAGALALYFGLIEEIDKSLIAEKSWINQKVNSEFFNLSRTSRNQTGFLKSLEKNLSL